MKILTLAFVLMMTLSTFSQTPTIESGVPQTLAKWRAANYSDVRYGLNLTLEKMSPTLKGTITVSLKNKADQIILDWRKIRGSENLSTVSNITVNSAPAKYEEINEHLVFKEGVKNGENTIKLDFTSPILTSGSAITRYVDKEDGAEYLYSLFVPSDASTAFPVFDQPDLKAKFSLSVNAPESWKVVSNTYSVGEFYIDTFGKNAKPENIKSKTIKPGQWNFEETKPISTYVFAFAAGDYAEFTGEFSKSDNDSMQKLPDNPEQLQEYLKKIAYGAPKIYVRKSQAKKFEKESKEVFRLNREGVKFLESYFDYKFPFPKYDLVLIPEFPFGGMEHAGATFLREASVIFPTEPTKNDYVSRANVIFHEAAHQWFGDTVTMKWFDDLWLKEGFAEFMAYKTLEKVMPEYNAWKIFYERNKQAAYLTDSTKGTTPIYQEISNLSAAKSAYGNIVYRKAPSFLRQAEFYLGADKFQTAVRTFLKKHQYANAGWSDLLSEFEKNSINVFWKRSGFSDAEWAKLEKNFEKSSDGKLKDFAEFWIKQRGLYSIKLNEVVTTASPTFALIPNVKHSVVNDKLLCTVPLMKSKVLIGTPDGKSTIKNYDIYCSSVNEYIERPDAVSFVFPNYQDYGYGVFLLDEKSRVYILSNIQNEKDDFLRTMMWGSLWDSVREAELAPKDYVALVIKNINTEPDESTINTLLNRVSTAMSYYLTEEQAKEFAPQMENLLIQKMETAPTIGQRITYYRSFLGVASSEKARTFLKDLLSGKSELKGVQLKTKDKFDIVTKLMILSDADAPNLLAGLEKTETSDEAKRYAYAAKAGSATAENKAKFWNDFVNNKEISESWIESAFGAFNSVRHSELTLPYLEKALAELPNLKRNRKIFFVNGWLGAHIGGQKSEQALAIVNKFLADNPNLDKDLRLKILENADGLERAVKIRAKFKA